MTLRCAEIRSTRVIQVRRAPGPRPTSAADRRRRSTRARACDSPASPMTTAGPEKSATAPPMPASAGRRTTPATAEGAEARTTAAVRIAFQTPDDRFRPVRWTSPFAVILPFDDPGPLGRRSRPSR